MSRLCLVLLALSLSSLPAAAAEPVDPVPRGAEDVRLSEQMATLARKAQWEGVERAYQALEQPTAADHLLGAQAARHHGDLDQVKVRVDRAVQAGDTREAPGWQADLQARTRPVELTGQELLAVPPPFTPDGMAVLDRANAALQAEGHYQGRLYTGDYELDGHGFTVRPGSDLLDVVAPPPPEPSPADDTTSDGPDLSATADPARGPDVPEPPQPRDRPSAGKLALLGVAGGLAVTSGALYATGARRRALWADATDVRDVKALRTQTNRFTTLSGATFGVALGVGGISLLLP